MAKMDIRTFRAPIKTSATGAIFLAELSKRRSTVRPSSRSSLQTSLGHAFLVCSRSYYIAAGWLRSKLVSLRKAAHAIRANLFASATTTALRCTPRSIMSSSHCPKGVSVVESDGNAARAP